MRLSRASAPVVLVVDDEHAIRRALERSLRMDGFDVELACDGREALDRVRMRVPAVIVLDLAMPGLDGLSVVRMLRGRGFDVPICILSARDEVGDRVAGLQSGADDYVIKPFAVEELTARLRALLRRRGHPVRAEIELGDLRVEPTGRLAVRGGRDLGLTPREFDLLEVFARHPAIVLTRDQLLELVWGYDFTVETNVVDVFVGYLRRKLEADGGPRIIHTVRGLGFVLRT